MRYKLVIISLLLAVLFLFNSCELLNPLIGNSTNKPVVNPDTQNFEIAIERLKGAFIGQGQAVEITLQNNTAENYQLGSFDFVIAYDASALLFQSVDPGQFLLDCGWEYFTYSYVGEINCDSCSTTSTAIRITVIAETNNGAGNHPDCFNIEGAISNQLTVLNFLVTNDRTFECAFAPISFYWYDCGDNVIRNQSDSLTFLSKHIYNQSYDYNNKYIVDYGNDFAKETSFSTYFGANSSCDTDSTNRRIDFINGGIDIVCADSIDGRGDLNLNEIAYEIADAVLYSNYFVYGISVFSMNIDGSIAASDVNADGLNLTVADLVYCIRVLVGDASPYPKDVVNEPSYVNGSYQRLNNGVVSEGSGINIAAAHIVVVGDITPVLLADDMTMIADFDGTNTRILIYSLGNNNFRGDMVNIGSNEIVSLDMADNIGNQVVAKLTPQTYVLAQNYPNPFNPSTTIEFSMPQDAFVTLDIYNATGQKVASFSGNFEAGVHSFEWDATDFPSGYYQYTLRINDFVDSKTMLKVG